VKYYLPFVATSAAVGGMANTYQRPVRGDTGVGGDVYQVFVNGLDTGRALTLTAGAGLWTVSAEYYLASVDIRRDGLPWEGTSVTLWRSDARAYTLSYHDDGPNSSYRALYVQKYDDVDLYDVRVAGSISGTDTGIELTEAAPTGAAVYYSVSYVDGESAYLTQTVKDGDLAAEPSAPYHAGSTFMGWHEEGVDTDYDFDTPVTGKLKLIAGYHTPSVVIGVINNTGGYVRCDIDGNVDPAGKYYLMSNLAVRGFPLTGQPISAATLHVTNGAITFRAGSTAGYTVHYNLDAAGTGTVSIVFNKDNVSQVSVNTAQQFLRNDVIVKVEDEAVQHRMKVSVRGMTN
jgi:hypothetical protein